MRFANAIKTAKGKAHLCGPRTGTFVRSGVQTPAVGSAARVSRQVPGKVPNLDVEFRPHQLPEGAG